MSNSLIEKAALTITKLQGQDNWCWWSTTICVMLGHTWTYVEGDNVSPPNEEDENYPQWVIEEHSAHQRIFLTLSDEVQETVLMYADSSASDLFITLKDQYEHSGVSAVFYTKQNYENAKLSEYNMIGDFIVRLTNLAHIVNKETTGDGRRIENWDIAMQVLHSLPPCLCMIQTLILKTILPTNHTSWNLSDLNQTLTNEE